MGCGQSKINIYPRKSKGKNNAKKIATDKPEGEEEENTENEQDSSPSLEDSDGKKKPVKAKPHVGGPLLAQAELSSSQQNFFKMLDEKIESGPDYDSNDETEIALETARLHTLLKDWETASVSSRSLPSTPRHIPRPTVMERPVQSAPKPHSRIPPNVIHQSYGVTQQQQIPYHRQTNYNPTYQSHSPSHQPHYMPNVSKIVQGIQYQDYQPVTYVSQTNYQHPPPQAVLHQQLPRQYSHPMPNTVPSTAGGGGSPVHYANNSPKHKYPTAQPHPSVSSMGYVPGTVQNSPTHKMYVPSQQNQGYTNGELIIQQQLYNQQVQYQQSREYQLYRQSREQLLVQQQICATGYTPAPPTRGSHYQSSVHVPIVSVLPQNDQSPKMSLQRKQQRQYSQEMT